MSPAELTQPTQKTSELKTAALKKASITSYSPVVKRELIDRERVLADEIADDYYKLAYMFTRVTGRDKFEDFKKEAKLIHSPDKNVSMIIETIASSCRLPYNKEAWLKEEASDSCKIANEYGYAQSELKAVLSKITKYDNVVNTLKVFE